MGTCSPIANVNIRSAKTSFDIPAPIQAVVPSLPGDTKRWCWMALAEGCEQVQMGNMTNLKYNSTYFQPVSVNDQPAYEVVNME
ncbi:MAG: DUF6515 family protein [Bacteroidota bacterium]|nr:DUF6515 family protein [Bacteroidota bacterium]MDP4211854.1 DUF6515 family protein [Bacteroidota bacterium]MDP4250938.1 DUF6515 family protein [Bacteroidota bacterium]